VNEPEPNPFAALFGEVARLFATSGPVNWEIARQVARWMATGGQPETNVDPLVRIRLEELARVAELHVAEATGLSTSSSGPVVARPVGRAEWAERTLDAWRPLLEALAGALAEGMEGSSPEDPDGPAAGGSAGRDTPPAPGDPDQLVGGWASLLTPLVLGLQSGSMVGQLATRAFGQYHLPIPRTPADEVLLVPENLAAFSRDWSLPEDDVRLWVCLEEMAHHSVLRVPHLRQRLEELFRSYMAGFRPDAALLGERMTNLDLTDLSSLQDALGDPDALLGEMQSPAQRAMLPTLEALVAALEGYVDHVVDRAGRRLIGSYDSLAEALRRRRVERAEGERLVERLFGLELGQAQYDRGAAFASGVVERAGEEALARLWESARALPTPAEVDAPGLWLARIDLPDDGP
jgi:putative hydrolase